MIADPFHAYRNFRPEVDWNTCGQAAIATIADFHGANPYGLARSATGQDGRPHWRDGEAIDAIKNAGLGPDVVFGWGTTGGRMRDAFRTYGMHADVGYSGLASTGWEQLWTTLQSYLAANLPVPVMLDLGAVGGQWYTVHWSIAYRIDSGRVRLGNFPFAAPTIDDFLRAWHCWFLPYGFNHCAVYSRGLPTQHDWRWCNRCQGLFFGPGVAASRCPAGGSHAAPNQSGSGNYRLWHDVPADPERQTDWRWCNRCQGLFFGPGAPSSSCPAGGTHATATQSGSGNYALSHGVPQHPRRQRDWRWCNRCHGLYFGPGAGASRCPRGGTHAPAGQSGSGDYSLMHE